MGTEFVQLNHGWNADPNVPNERIEVAGGNLVLRFRMNPYQYPEFSEDDVGILQFRNCWRYRLGDVNDEGWYLGQCRFSNLAPDWGEFYQVSGDLLIERDPEGWISIGLPGSKSRHYLFYLRDSTFECDADAWDFSVERAGSR